jgi:arylsulfatase A
MLVCALHVPCNAHAQSRNAQRPNVVLIMTDDVGYGDIGSYGAPDIKTPHIDGLARDGVRMTDFYANGATCTPTRAGLISGRYQQRVGLERPLGVDAVADLERGLIPTGRSLPQLLKNSGYVTALVGKWHLGWKTEFSPGAHGFDFFFGFKNGYIDFYHHTDGDGRPDLYENARSVQVTGYMTDLITDRSVQFIKNNAQRPFFIDVAYNAAHWPYQVPDKPSKARENSRHLGPLDDSTSTRADYIAMLERADHGVGVILKALDSLGLRDNTIVIFTNDNGGEWLSRNAPLFHSKASVWEGGIRVPTIVRWPARIPAGTVSDQVGITMDLTATILAAANAVVPDDTRLDGIDLMSVLEGRTPTIERTLFWRVNGVRQQRAVRSGDWKLMFDGPRALLFNLRSDIGERTELIGAHSEIARRLFLLLTAWQSDVDDESKRRTLR